MGVKPNNEDKPDTNYIFSRKAGRSIIERRPVFSPDGEYVNINNSEIILKIFFCLIEANFNLHFQVCIVDRRKYSKSLQYTNRGLFSYTRN